MTQPGLIILAAQSQIGVREAGENAGTPLERYGLLGDVAAPWCARFVRWCIGKAGGQVPGNQYQLGNVAYMRERFIVLGWGQTSPQPGDVVFYKNGAGSDKEAIHHCGIVVAVQKNNFNTVEGNYGDQVSSRTIPWPNSSVSGFGRIPEG